MYNQRDYSIYFFEIRILLIFATSNPMKSKTGLNLKRKGKMQDSEERKTKDSQTINIEIPTGSFEGMFRMMSGRGASGKTGSSCCESSTNKCRPQAEEGETKEINIVIKRKEQ